MSDADEHPPSSQDLESSLAAGDLPAGLSNILLDYLARGTEREAVQGMLDAYRAHRDWGVDFERSLARDRTGGDLAELVRTMLDSGVDRKQLYDRLSAFMMQLRSEGREDEDDTVTDVLEMFLEQWS
jgi:hypothetical protein